MRQSVAKLFLSESSQEESKPCPRAVASEGSTEEDVFHQSREYQNDEDQKDKPAGPHAPHSAVHHVLHHRLSIDEGEPASPPSMEVAGSEKILARAAP